MRESIMRCAFRSAVERALSKSPVPQLKLVKAIVRCHDRGAGLIRSR